MGVTVIVAEKNFAEFSVVALSGVDIRGTFGWCNGGGCSMGRNLGQKLIDDFLGAGLLLRGCIPDEAC